MRKIARLSDEERAELFRNTADRIKLHDAVVEKISVVCLICLKFFQIIIFGKSSISVFMVSRAIFDFCRFLKIGKRIAVAFRSVGISPPSDLYAHCAGKIYACAASCGGQLSAAPFRTPFARKIVKIMELVEI